jgi:threonine dehydrogenase-like Zn-dependent dehydrogenase
MGHEFVGRVVETGAGIRGFAPGDRAACPFSTSRFLPIEFRDRRTNKVVAELGAFGFRLK